MKYVKNRISVKIFLLNLGILMVIVGCTYGFISIFMLHSYSASLNGRLEEKAEVLVESLKNYTLEDARIPIQKFSNENQTDVILLDEKGTVIQGWNNYGENVSLEGTEELAEKQITGGHYPVLFKNSGKLYTLLVFDSVEPVNQLAETMNKIIPGLILLSFIVSVIVAFIYSKYLSKAVIDLSAASEKMANLDFSVHTAIKRTDEIGVISENLNVMSRNLDRALKKLQDANSKLKSEQEQERDSERRRMEFLAAASHELRTPIAILKEQIEGMESNIGVYKDRDLYLAKAKIMIEKLQKEVQKILMISKMESEDLVAKKKETNLAEIIRIQVAELYNVVEEKNMELIISLPTICKCMVDSELMETAIRNLLENAIHYSPEGEKIKVELCESEQEKEISFKIENTGVHIPEQDLVHIYDAFYRVESSGKSAGSGLGLYIVRGILEQHGCKYEIKNTHNGVLFQFQIANGTVS